MTTQMTYWGDSPNGPDKGLGTLGWATCLVP